VLLQVALMAGLGPFNSAMVNPNIVVLAKMYNISPVEAAYQSTVGILAQGIAPLIWVPFANVYGRRPVLLITALITVVASWGSGYASTWPRLIVARLFSGLASGAAMAVGTAVVNDIWYMHGAFAFKILPAKFSSNCEP
jgi:MFS family permease